MYITLQKQWNKFAAILFIESPWYELASRRAGRADEGVKKIFGGLDLCLVPRVLLDGLPGKPLRVALLVTRQRMRVFLVRGLRVPMMVSTLPLTSYLH